MLSTTWIGALLFVGKSASATEVFHFLGGITENSDASGCHEYPLQVKSGKEAAGQLFQAMKIPDLLDIGSIRGGSAFVASALRLRHLWPDGLQWISSLRPRHGGRGVSQVSNHSA